MCGQLNILDLIFTGEKSVLSRINIPLYFKRTDITVNIFREQSFTHEEKWKIISEFHGTPVGECVKVKRLQLHHQWRNMKKDVKHFIKNCDICQKIKSNYKNKQLMLITTTTSHTFERICLDILGPLPQNTSGKIYILTSQDELSRFLVAIALNATNTEIVAHAFLRFFISNIGIPTSILTDCNTNFLSNLYKQTCKLLGIEK